MKRLGASWSVGKLCRGVVQQPQHHAKTISSLALRRRKGRPGGPLRKTYPTLDIPYLVLDLDAEDNPHVRLYDEVDKELESSKWKANAQVEAILERLDEFHDEVAETKQWMQSTASRPNPWRVSDQDILAIALLGSDPESTGPHSHGSAVTEVVYRNGIPSRVKSDRDKTIPFLLQRQAIAGKQPSTAKTAIKSDAAASQGVFWKVASSESSLSETRREITSGDDFRRALGSCQGIVEIRRLIAPLVRTEAGCKIVSQSSAQVAQSLARLTEAGASGDDLAAALTLVHNLTNGLASRSIDIGAPLCQLGLQLSSLTLQPAAIRKYLGIGLEAGYLSGESDAAGASSTISASLAAILRALRTPQSGPDASPDLLRWKGTQSGHLTLLTGQSIVAGLQPAFRTALPNSAAAAHATYLQLLAELGAVRSLLHERHSSSNPLESRDGKSQKQAPPTVYIPAETLVTAVLRSTENKSWRRLQESAASTLGDGWDDGLLATGSVHDDISRDIRDVSTHAAHPASAASLGTSRTARVSHSPVSTLKLPDMGSAKAVDAEFLNFQESVVRAYGKTAIQDAMKDIGSLAEHPYAIRWLKGGGDTADA